MDKILFINSCIRPESRTYLLANHLLSKMNGQVEEVNLEREAIPALNTATLKYKQELLLADKFDDPMMFAQLERCAAVPTETILFNIDSKSPINKDKTAILRVFAKVFY